MPKLSSSLRGGSAPRRAIIRSQATSSRPCGALAIILSGWALPSVHSIVSTWVSSSKVISPRCAASRNWLSLSGLQLKKPSRRVIKVTLLLGISASAFSKLASPPPIIAMCSPLNSSGSSNWYCTRGWSAPGIFSIRILLCRPMARIT